MRLKIPLSRYLTRSIKANAPKTMFTAGSIQSDMTVLQVDSSVPIQRLRRYARARGRANAALMLWNGTAMTFS